MSVEKKTVNENFLNEKPPTGRGRFLKQIKYDLYRDSW